MLTIVIFIIFSILMIWAGYSDVTSYTLSNRLCLSTVLLYPIYILATYLDGHSLPIQSILIALAISAVIFIVCAVFFALGFMGGGDVKLIPAVALWAGPDYILDYLFITSVMGGLLAAAIIVKNRIIASKYHKSSENINLSMAKKESSAVPYGVGIAIGGIYVAYQLFSAFDHRII